MSRYEWTKAKVEKEWRYFDVFEKKFYQYARECAIDDCLDSPDSSDEGLTDEQRLSVSSIAVERVFAFRRWRGRRNIDPRIDRILKVIRL